VALGARARRLLWSKEVGPEVMDLSLFSNFIDRMRQILVQVKHGDASQSMCHNDMCFAACSEPVHRLTVSLAMMLLWIRQWWRLDVSYNVRLGGIGVWRRPLASASAGSPRGWFWIFLSFNVISAMFLGQLFFGLSFSFHVCVFM
jgi:hypothetical protein